MGGIVVIFFVLDERGLIMFLPAGMQKQLMEVSLLEWLLADTFGKMIRNAIKDLGPLFLSKDEAERKQCLESMSRGTKKKLVKRGLAFMFPKFFQRILLPRYLRAEAEKIRIKNNNTPKSPHLFRKGDKVGEEGGAERSISLPFIGRVTEKVLALFRRAETRGGRTLSYSQEEEDESPFSAAARDRMWNRLWGQRRKEIMQNLPNVGAKFLEAFGINLADLDRVKATARTSLLTCAGLFAVWLALSSKTRRGTVTVMKAAAVRGTTVFASAGVVMALVRLSLYLQKQMGWSSSPSSTTATESASREENNVSISEKLKRFRRRVEMYVESEGFGNMSNSVMGGCATAVVVLLLFRQLTSKRSTRTAM